MKCCARGEIEDGTALGFQMILYVYICESLRENLAEFRKVEWEHCLCKRIMEGKEKNSKFCVYREREYLYSMMRPLRQIGHLV